MDVVMQHLPVMYQKLTAPIINNGNVSSLSPDVVVAPLKNLIYSKESTMSPTNERDAGFCSGSSENEEDLLDQHQVRRVNSECSNSSQSPNTDVGSEDSSLGDKFIPPTTPAPLSAPKNKRKSSEPIRVVSELSQCGPIKKRIKFENEKMLARAQAESKAKLSEPMLSPDSANPFRPWANLMPPSPPPPPPTPFHLDPAHSFKRHPGVTTLHRIPMQAPKFEMPMQDEPISLVAKKSPPTTTTAANKSRTTSEGRSMEGSSHNKAIREMMMKQKTVEPPKPFEFRPEDLRTGAPAAHGSSIVLGSRTPSLIDETSSTASSSFISPGTLNLSTKMHNSEGNASSLSVSCGGEKGGRSKDAAQGAQRNYKNMTRERRIEANARERTRVHTISAAFDKLRHSIPAYSNTQKLSKLSVLRIACSYIMSLSRIADMDYSEDQSEPSIGECVDALTKTIQTEGKLRKKKDE